MRWLTDAIRSRLSGPRSPDERGAALLVAGVGLTALLAAGAIVVDLAAARADRSSNQTATDSAATAGALALSAVSSGADGCEAALAYVELNIGQALSGGVCSSFPSACTASTPALSTTATAGGITATITYPVPDGHELMQPGAVGYPTVGVTNGDGQACDRIGVRIDEERNTFFAGVAGITTQTTSVHSVAIAHGGGDNSKAINLLILHPTDCESITTHGGGGIIVKPVTDPITAETFPGLISSDSDGTTNCGSRGAIHANGAGATIRADGEPGCAVELASGPGHGCGVIDVYANGGPGCVLPACSSTGVIAPDPGQPTSRMTRAQIDYRFNCKTGYPASYGISDCKDAGTQSAYIDDLVADIGPSGMPPGFQSYTGAGYPCNINNNKPETIPVGNWWVDCDLNIKDDMVFEGGNIVFDDDVTVTTDGTLTVNTANTQAYNWLAGSPVDHTEHSAGAAYVYMRDGDFVKTSQASVAFHNTFLYVSPSSGFEMRAGSGTVSFVAPTEGPFKDLAMWSESSSEHLFTGSAGLQLEGVFFAPNALVRYTGGGSQQQVAAQFIASKLEAGGNSSLVIQPIYSRMVLFPSPEYSQLIR